LAAFNATLDEVAGNYPSKAGIFDHDWQKKFGMSYPEIEWPPTSERFTGKPMWDEYRAKYKDGAVIVHMMKEEMAENEELVKGVFAGKSVRAHAQNKGRAK